MDFDWRECDGIKLNDEPTHSSSSLFWELEFTYELFTNTGTHQKVLKKIIK